MMAEGRMMRGDGEKVDSGESVEDGQPKVDDAEEDTPLKHQQGGKRSSEGHEEETISDSKSQRLE